MADQSPSATAAAEQAWRTFDAVTTVHRYDPERCLFGTRHVLGGRRFAHLWPYANTWSACAALASLPSHPRGRSVMEILAGFPAGLTAYCDRPDVLDQSADPVGFASAVVPPLGDGGEAYYDDNAWIGLAMLRHHQVTGQDRLVQLGRRVLAWVLTGWTTDATWRHPGGIRWKDAPTCTSRNTCANAPTAALAVLVHQACGDPKALDWAVRIYEWTRTALLGPDDLYGDRIDPRGAVEPTRWSYNQGSMIGAGLLLHHSTGDPSYLAQAQSTAAAAVHRFSAPALGAQGAAFAAVLLRNLFLLGTVAPDPRYRQLAADFGAEQWAPGRRMANGLFRGTGSTLGRTAPMIEVYALLAGATPHP